MLTYALSTQSYQACETKGRCLPAPKAKDQLSRIEWLSIYVTLWTEGLGVIVYSWILGNSPVQDFRRWTTLMRIDITNHIFAITSAPLGM